MSHWAEINEDKVVLRVVVGDTTDPKGDEGYSWVVENLGGTWIKTSYNNNGLKFAAVGDTWDGNNFISPPSLTIQPEQQNTEGVLSPGMPEMPQDGKDYFWEEKTWSWVEMYELPGGEEGEAQYVPSVFPEPLVITEEQNILFEPLREARRNATSQEEIDLIQAQASELFASFRQQTI